MTKRSAAFPFACLAAIVCTASTSAQLYRNSVVATDFDYIIETDPSAFVKLEFVKLCERQMNDKRQDSPETKQAYVFNAFFSDNTRVVFAIDAAFGSEDAARTEALRYVHPLGKLPTALRAGIRRGLIVHKGGEDTTAFADPGVIAVYSENATKRISTHDLEETFFHESVHAAWDRNHARSEAWLAAQEKDGAFVTEYAKKKPKNEDLAESALFAFALLHHPDRIPADDARRIRELIPARIAYVATLLPPGEPLFKPVDPAKRPAAEVVDWCSADIGLTGVLKDILSNSLRIDFAATSDVLGEPHANSEALFQAVVTERKLKPDDLKASIRRNLHTNCKHGPVDEYLADEQLANWKAPAPKASASRTPASDQTASADVPRAEMGGVVSELRWISWILIVGVFSNIVLIALHFHRPKPA